MFRDIVSQFTPEAGIFFAVTFSVLFVLLVVVGLAVLGRIRLPARRRRAAMHEAQEGAARSRGARRKQGGNKRGKLRDGDAAPQTTVERPVSRERPPLPAVAAAVPSSPFISGDLSAANGGTKADAPHPDSDPGIEENTVQLEALPDLPLPLGGQSASGAATDGSGAQPPVDEPEIEEEEEQQAPTRGSSVFDVFTEAVVEETDAGRFAKTLQNVRIEDILAEAEVLRGRMPGRD